MRTGKKPKPNPKQPPNQLSVREKYLSKYLIPYLNWGWVECLKQSISLNLKVQFLKTECPEAEYSCSYTHFTVESELPDPISHFDGQYIVFKTRNSIEQHKTGHGYLRKSDWGLLHCFQCSLLCCNWLFWDETGETGMLRQRPLDGPTSFWLGCG